MNSFRDSGSQHRLTGLKPVISPQCRILILGSFPSSLSLQKGEYYAHPRNDFWKIMEAVLGVSLDYPYLERIIQLNQRGVGLWDVLQSCTRRGSADSAIRNPELTQVQQMVERYPGIRCLACNGRKAEAGLSDMLRKNGKLSRPVDIVYLPSSSPAHAVRFEEKKGAWMILRLYLSQSS